MTILTYLPHLHSFTFEAMARLFELYGYEIVAKSADWRVVTVAGRRVAKSVVAAREVGRSPALAGRPAPQMRQKLIRGLGLGKRYRAPQRRLWWVKKADIGGQIPYRAGSAMRRLHYGALMQLYRLKNQEPFSRGTQSLLIEDLPRRFFGEGESPLEVQFAGPITLYYK